MILLFRAISNRLCGEGKELEAEVIAALAMKIVTMVEIFIFDFDTKLLLVVLITSKIDTELYIRKICSRATSIVSS